MSWILELYRSALGKKAIMAVTGVLLFAFVVGHLAGNLKLYQGPEKINAYAEGLRDLGAPILGHGQALWIARLGLIAAVGLHILAAVQLTRMNLTARPWSTRYRHRMSPQASTYASRTMRWSGVILLLFVVYHLLHLTFGSVHPEFIPGDVYRNVVVGFQQPLVSVFYIVAQIALGFHLYHGLWSLFQSLGWSGPNLNRFRKLFAVAFAWIITLGNISFPVAVWTGLITL